MKNRIIDNWKATLLGFGILTVSLALVWFGKATFTEVSGFLLTSGLLLWVKDSIFKINE